MKLSRILLILAAVLVSDCLQALATGTPDLIPKEAGIEEHLDQQVDLELEFIDTNGSAVPLRSLIRPNRPALIVPVYYRCPRLCSFTLNGMLEAVNGMDLELGADYSIITFSINPREGPALAKAKAQNYFGELTEPSAGPQGWHFLTGTTEAITRLTDQLGFKFKEDQGEYSHSAAFMILTPGGRISRYFYGVKYPARDVRYSLIEAAQGRIGTTLDKVFLYCFRYDDNQARYTPLIWNITRLICLGFALLLLLLLGWLRLKERRTSEDV